MFRVRNRLGWWDEPCLPYPAPTDPGGALPSSWLPILQGATGPRCSLTKSTQDIVYSTD